MKYWRRSSRWRAAFKKASLRHRSRLESLAVWGTPYDTLWRIFYIESQLMMVKLNRVTKYVWHCRENAVFPAGLGEVERKVK